MPERVPAGPSRLTITAKLRHQARTGYVGPTARKTEPWGEVGDATVAYDTSEFPEKLKQLGQGVREFLQHASTALDRDVAS